MLNISRLNQLKDRYKFLEARLNENPAISELKILGQEYAELKPIIIEINEYDELLKSLEEAKDLLNDPEMRVLANDEINNIEDQIEEKESALMISLIPKDASDNRSVILEIRAGTGGEEASLFAIDLLKMYQKYSERNGWVFDILDESSTEVGGIREAIINIKGDGAFGLLKFESGVHRVQRVPDTESSGRVHTSAATVAVLAEAEEVDIEINSVDLRIDTMRSSGAGGQHVNTTDSAVRITHLPTGIVVTSSEKSQHQNRAKAMQVLRSKLLDLERSKTSIARASDRKEQVGSGDRSERIRTYNFPQGRVTDHRINLTLYKLEEIMSGGLTEIINSLVASDNAKKLAEL